MFGSHSRVLEWKRGLTVNQEAVGSIPTPGAHASAEWTVAGLLSRQTRVRSLPLARRARRWTRTLASEAGRASSILAEHTKKSAKG